MNDQIIVVAVSCCAITLFGLILGFALLYVQITDVPNGFF